MGGSVRRGAVAVVRGGRTVACGIGGLGAELAAAAAAVPPADFNAFSWPIISLSRVLSDFWAV